jgi:hypothetical protein
MKEIPNTIVSPIFKARQSEYAQKRMSAAHAWRSDAAGALCWMPRDFSCDMCDYYATDMSAQAPAILTAAELYQTHGRRVFNLAYRMTGNRATAEDVLQEVFVRVMEHANSFRGESSIYSWIFAIARNVC